MGGQQACHEPVGVHRGRKLVLLVLAALPYYQVPLAYPREDLASPHLPGEIGTRLWDLMGAEARCGDGTRGSCCLGGVVGGESLDR